MEITARDKAGNTLGDKMFLHVERPTVHRIQHACTDHSAAVYVQGERVDIYHGLAMSDGRPVIGYGYLPVRVAPASALELVGQSQGVNVYSYRALTRTSNVTVRGLQPDRADEGPQPHADICTVTAKLEDDDGTETNHEQLAVVQGLKFGVCKYEVTLPELDGGRGVTLTGEAKVGSLKFPGEGAPLDTARLLERSLSAWALAGLGWLMPNLVVLGLIMLRRRRHSWRQSSSATP